MENRRSWFRSPKATLKDLKKLEENIMSAISEFAARQNAFNDKIDAAVEGLVADVAGLKAEIEVLQNTPGAITPEDQALLDSIEVRTKAISDRLDALDALTPPVAPGGEPVANVQKR